MRIVVFSDSHKNFFALRNIVNDQRTADLFIHLGDGEQDFDELCRIFPGKKMLNVRGNCDWASLTPVQGMINCEGHKLFYTHGHTYHVKAGLDDLIRQARNLGAKIAVFGHTHLAMEKYEDGLYLLNPGSVSHPVSGSPSYGVVDITKAGIVTSIVTI